MTSIEQKGISPKVSSVSKGIAVIFMLIHHLFSCNKSCYDEYGVFSYVLSTSDINKISAVF